MTLGDILMAGCAACVWGYHICMRICAIVCPGITAVATGAADPSVQTVREIRIDEDAEKRRALGGRGGATALGLICRWLNLLHQISRVGVAIQAHTVCTPVHLRQWSIMATSTHDLSASGREVTCQELNQSGHVKHYQWGLPSNGVVGGHPNRMCP